MANEYEMSPKELKAQADAILAAADAAEAAVSMRTIRLLLSRIQPWASLIRYMARCGARIRT